jgi:hypothetical protein
LILETLLDQVQSVLHDDETVWTREELLRWADDGYRLLCYTSACVARPYNVDIPGRVSAAFSHFWELTEHPGTYRVFTRAVGSRPPRCLYLWEVENFENITPTDSYEVTTQLWEEAYSGETDAHFRFALPRQTDRPLKVYWDSKRLAHTTARELDQSFDRWWKEGGEPIATLPGVGPEKSLEVYLVQTSYVQSYNLKSFENGLPRNYSSDADRTYGTNSIHTTWDYGYTGASVDSGMVTGTGLLIPETVVDATTGSRGLFSWESDLTTTAADENGNTPGTIYTHFWEGELFGETQLGVGVSRWLKSDDRQYFGVAYDSGQDLLGIARRIASSDDSLTVWSTIIPDRPLTEEDEPDLIPEQCNKYIKYYVLAQAFARKGEGNRPDMSEHFATLFSLGAGLLAMLGTPSVLDRVYAREQVRDASIQAPPRVRFPAEFPRAS